MDISERKTIDLLISEFWRLGYFTVSRRLGTYLPEPENVGKFSVDAIGRQKDKYAIGIILTKEDIYKSDFLERIEYLATRKSRSSGKPITLFIGVTNDHYKRVKELIANVNEKIRRNIKLVQIDEGHIGTHEYRTQSHQMIFS